MGHPVVQLVPLQVPSRQGSESGAPGRGGVSGVAGRKVHHLRISGNSEELRVSKHVRLWPDEAG